MAPTVTAPGCAICGSRGALQPKLRKNGYDIVRCPSCGVGRAIAPGFDPRVFYTEGYFAGEQEGAYVDYAGSEKVLRQEFSRQVGFLRRFVPGGKLLEIGCAYGFFLQEAKPFFAGYGVEMAQPAVDHCHRSGLASVAQGMLTRDYLESGGPFDAIVMLDVIEHIDDVSGTMELALSFLKPGGMAMVTTGDWSSAVARLTGASWRLIAPPLHLWYFTPDSLEKMFRRFGCRLVHLSHPWKLVPIDLIFNQVGLMLGRNWRPTLPAPLRCLGLPANLFDAARLVFRKQQTIPAHPENAVF